MSVAVVPLACGGDGASGTPKGASEAGAVAGGDDSGPNGAAGANGSGATSSVGGDASHGGAGSDGAAGMQQLAKAPAAQAAPAAATHAYPKRTCRCRLRPA